MAALRSSCVFLVAGLLIALPAQSAEKQKQSATRAGPQPVQRQQASPPPTLPAEGTSLGNPKGPSTGGPAGSMNMGKPMAPVGTQSVGGHATGGSAAAGAALGTPATNAKPTGGDTLVNPNAKNNPAGGAMPGDFSREKKLEAVVDGGAKGMMDKAGTKEATAPGQKSGAALIDGNKSNFEAMRGDPGSRTSQQGMVTNTQIAPAPTTPPAGGAPTPYPAPAGAAPAEPKIIHVAPKQPSGSSSGDEPGTLKGTASGTNMGKAGPTTDNFTTLQGTVPNAAALSGVKKGGAATPTPDGATGTPVPAAVSNLGGKGPTLEQTKKERGRQTTLPNEDKQQVDRMKADQRAAGATMAERRTNLINPGEQGTTAGVPAGGPPPAKPGAQQGRPGSSTGGAPPKCPPDNPTC